MKERIKTPRKEVETIVGVLIPNGWNAGFDVTSLSLACDGEREIGINNFNDYPELLNLLRKQITISGTVIRDGEVETVEIASFRIINGRNANL